MTSFSDDHNTKVCLLTQFETVLFLSFGTFGRLEHLLDLELVVVLGHHLVDDSDQIVNLTEASSPETNDTNLIICQQKSAFETITQSFKVCDL